MKTIIMILLIAILSSTTKEESIAMNETKAKGTMAQLVENIKNNSDEFIVVAGDKENYESYRYDAEFDCVEHEIYFDGRWITYYTYLR